MKCVTLKHKEKGEKTDEQLVTKTKVQNKGNRATTVTEFPKHSPNFLLLLSSTIFNSVRYLAGGDVGGAGDHHGVLELSLNS
ncbi:hypothetical protein RJT34_26193 [Clitoria ternatea]|uniref:Uncharacterized protein n=1 Tax=Clitoria ternatea TaxID=43366 RepID=A0AAN9FB24_CLITE